MTDELLNENIEETTKTHIELPQRKNEFCIIAKVRWTNGGYDIQTNSSWSVNPLPETYAVVPDDMVEAIRATGGFCDIVLNKEGTEVVSFSPLKKPDIPTPKPVLTPEQKRIAELEEQLAATQNALIELYESMEV